MQACALILLPSSIFSFFFICLFLPIFPILNLPEDKYMDSQWKYTAGYFGGINISVIIKKKKKENKSFIGPDCESYPIKVSTRFHHLICFLQTKPPPEFLN